MYSFGEEVWAIVFHVIPLMKWLIKESLSFACSGVDKRLLQGHRNEPYFPPATSGEETRYPINC